MAQYITLESWITSIADAIRNKTNSSSKIIAETFPEVIATIGLNASDTSDATATINDLRKGVSAYSQGIKIIGNMEEYEGEFIII